MRAGKLNYLASAEQWKDQGKPHRQDRKWSTAWNPEQISERLKVEFPDNCSMRISYGGTSSLELADQRSAHRREQEPFDVTGPPAPGANGRGNARA